MGVNVEELRAYFTANYSNFVNGTNRVIGASRKLGAEVSKVSQAASHSINRIGVTTVAVAAKAAQSFGQFESTMVRAGAVTNTLGTRDFAALQAKAREMGETTVFSASQAAEAIENMGLAGLSTREIIGALPGALQLASAAQVSIAQASDVAAKTMRAFGADASELAHINDVLVGTFTRSNTDLGQLAEAMKHVAPVSNGLGVSLEDTAAAIAKMSDAGFQGSMAGTALRNILSRLAGAMPEATSKLLELGVQTLDSAGKMRPFLDILADIERAGLTDAQVLQVFGQRGGPQLMAMLEVGTAGLRQFSTELTNSGGIAQRISDANLDTLNGQFMLLRSAIESIQIDLGKKLRPEMEGLFSFLQENREVFVNLADGFAKFVKAILSFVVEHPRIAAALALFKASSLLGINSLIVTLGGSIGRLTSELITFAAKTMTASMAMTGLKAGLAGLAVAGIAALAVKLYNANKDLQKFNDELQRSKRLSDELSDKMDRKLSRSIATAMEMGGERGRNFLSVQLERAKKDIEGLSGSVKGQRRVVEELSTTWNRYTGSKVLEGERENLADLETKLEAAKNRAQQLADAMSQIGTSSTVPQTAGAVSQIAAEGVSSAGDESDVENMLRDAQRAAMDAQASGATSIADLLGAGATGGQLAEFLGLSGMDEQTAAGFGNQLDSMGGFESQAAMDAFALKIAETMQAGIEAEEQRRELIEQNKQAMAQAREYGLSVVESIKELGNLDADVQTEFKQKFVDLNNALRSGKISAEQFAAGMNGLKQATDSAVEAAEKKRQQEIREQILKGDFSSLDPKKALEDKLFQYRMSQFNNQVDQTFNQMMGLGNAVKPVTSAFGELQGKMEQFGESLKIADSGQASQALSQFFNVVSSTEGQRALLFNEIQSLRQAFQYALDPRRRNEIQDRIAALSSSLNSLPTTPFVSGPARDPYADPGLGGSTVNISLPNISRVTNEDVRVLTNAVASEISRRGVRF